ncbi:hypothetical protein N7532_001508 [Penicillium argentinense]|uniref:Uncharacterized protein n=1 Tax=Penicillium argentinense TaxID=1131581 RepID=A0A9W9G2V8_9EURO|nr:uncharacterized protein N7532_001508 [Penicillium argentinense]KAJ5110973.1 hypothetical protein N7532_001508 [Penicillium argentinense]
MATQTISSILAVEPWYYDGDRQCIKFRVDGTGEIWDGHETAFTLAASFDWRALNPTALDEQLAITGSRTAKTLTHLSLEITSTERRCPCPPGWNFDENTLERIRMTTSRFKEGAFQPRTFSVRLESGRFAKPFMEDHGGVEKFGDQARSYALRLVFDRCPWPSLEQYINGSIWRDKMKVARTRWASSYHAS